MKPLSFGSILVLFWRLFCVCSKCVYDVATYSEGFSSSLSHCIFDRIASHTLGVLSVQVFL